MSAFKLLWIAVLFATVPVYAGFVNVPADVSVNLKAEPSAALESGQPIVFTISATNHGPKAVSNLLLISFDFVNEFDLTGATRDSQGLGLVVSDGEAFRYNYWWRPTFTGPLEVGETRSCHLTLALSSQAPAVWAFGFAVPFFYLDINPDNNTASVTLRRALEPATPIPKLSPLVLILLATILASIGCAARKAVGQPPK